MPLSLSFTATGLGRVQGPADSVPVVVAPVEPILLAADTGNLLVTGAGEYLQLETD